MNTKTLYTFAFLTLLITTWSLAAGISKKQISTRPTLIEDITMEFNLASIEDKFHTGVSAKWEKSMDPEVPLSAGARLGFLYGPSSPSSYVIPIQGVMTYRFESNDKMVPYVGISTGVAVIHVGKTTTELPTYTYAGYSFGGGSITTEGSTAVKFIGLVRPGLQVSQNMYFEIPMGTIGGNNYFSVAAGMNL